MEGALTGALNKYGFLRKRSFTLNSIVSLGEQTAMIRKPQSRAKEPFEQKIQSSGNSENGGSGRWYFEIKPHHLQHGGFQIKSSRKSKDLSVHSNRVTTRKSSILVSSKLIPPSQQLIISTSGLDSFRPLSLLKVIKMYKNEIIPPINQFRLIKREYYLLSNQSPLTVVAYVNLHKL